MHHFSRFCQNGTQGGVRGTTRDGERNRAASPAVPFRKYQNVVDVGRCSYRSLVCDLSFPQVFVESGTVVTN